MIEIKQRLVESSEACVKAFDKWSGDQKSSDSRETLQEAIHELRKVASRLEIELAISERDQNAAKPLPIPPHRASRGGKGHDPSMDDSLGNSAFEDDDNDAGSGNVPGGNASGGSSSGKPPLRRRLGSGSGPRRGGQE